MILLEVVDDFLSLGTGDPDGGVVAGIPVWDQEWPAGFPGIFW